MNLTKQQTNAIAAEIFDNLTAIRNLEIERMTPSWLSDKRYKKLCSLTEQKLEIEEDLKKIGNKILEIKKEFSINTYGNEMKKSYINARSKEIKDYKLDEIQRFITLASIEENDLASIIDAVTKKIQK